MALIGKLYHLVIKKTISDYVNGNLESTGQYLLW